MNQHCKIYLNPRFRYHHLNNILLIPDVFYNPWSINKIFGVLVEIDDSF